MQFKDPRNLRSDLDSQIVNNLRRAYNQTLEEAVPERFLNLLKELRAQEGTGDEQGQDTGHA